MNVRVLRVKRKWSQEGLAAKADVERTYLSGIERGEHNVSIITLLKLAKALGCSAADLLDGVRLSTRRK